MNQMPQIAWLIPCYNEAQTIGQVIAEIRSSCPGSQIYVYDNCSTDHTSAIAEKAGALVRKEPRKGKGSVVRRMFREVDADIYLMLDGDCTYDASSWKKMVEPIVKGEAEMVVGARLKQHDAKSFRQFHLLGNRLISGIIARFFGIRIRDVLSGYRAFSRRYVKDVGIEAFGFEIETELTVKAIEHRFNIVEIDLPYRSRPAGSISKLKTFEDGLLILLTILRLFKDHKPLTFGGSVAIFAALGSVICFLAGWEVFGNLLLNTVPVAIFGGLILNSVSQRSKEMTQVIVKAREMANPNSGFKALPGHTPPHEQLGNQETPWQRGA